MGSRRDNRDRIEAQIVELGRAQLASVGAAGLSVRAVARDLGMVSSAIYRYVPSRDDLLTLLLVHEYNALADAVDRAREDADDWRGQLRAMARAARQWAVSWPASWALLYGSPVPGYLAPAEATVAPGTRVVGAMLRVVSAAGCSSKIVVLQQVTGDFARLRAEFDVDGDDAAIAACFTLWAGLVGAISLEVFGQYGADTLTEPAAVFDLQIGALVSLLS